MDNQGRCNVGRESLSHKRGNHPGQDVPASTFRKSRVSIGIDIDLTFWGEHQGICPLENQGHAVLLGEMLSNVVAVSYNLRHSFST